MLIFLIMPVDVLANDHITSPSTREMDRINWMEFQKWIPNKINTALLSTGTLVFVLTILSLISFVVYIFLYFDYFK